MTPQFAFKVGFLKRCAELGLTSEETERTIKIATAFAKEAGIMNTIGSGVGKAIGLGESALGYGGIAALAAPPVLGAAAGAGLGALTDIDDEDVHSVKRQELIDEYLRNTARLQHRNRRFRALRPGMPAA